MKFLIFLWMFTFGIQMGFNHSSPTSFRGMKDMTNLINELSNDAFTSSSHQENFYPYRARSGGSGFAWCPKELIGSHSTEYIQVEFRELKIVSNLFSYGLDNGNIGFFVSKFYLDYQRENSSLWHRYRNEKGVSVMKGNMDSRNVQVTNFKSNIVAKRIRIIPISDVEKKVCLKFDLYGGPFNDCVVEYIIPQGDIFEDDIFQKYQLLDQTYDSNSVQSPNGAKLQGGIGQLMDNVADYNSITLSYEKGFNFVGWHQTEKRRKVEMVFRFDEIRIIENIRIHLLNDIHLKISVFSSAKFEFSTDEKNYGICSTDVFYVYKADSKLKMDRLVNIDLQKSIAKSVRVTLEFRLQWIVISEMQFNTSKLSNQKCLKEQIESKNIENHDIKSESTKIFISSKINYLLIVFCATISFVGLLCIISICILRLRRQRKRRIKGKPIHSLRYGNMTCNNVIPIPAVSSSNGGFYKPVPNGVYDCMPGFQSQTLNIRKVPAYPNQSLFGTYNNRKNSSPNSNTVMTSINPDNYGANLSHVVGQQTMNMFCPENKRASFDGSYAGTGSNPEYSNASLENSTVPVHLVPLTPTMYEQYKINSNHHHGLPNQFNLMSPVLSTFNQDSHQPFIDNFPVNSIAPTIMNNYGPGITPNGFLYQASNQCFDSSIILWPDELIEIIEKHSRYEVLLQSPVGGSMIVREKFDNNDLLTVKDYEKEVMEKLPKMEIDKLELQKQIGSGRYGSIHKGIYNGSVVVMKAINRDCVPSIRIQFLKMISDLMKISNKNVANVIGYCQYTVSDTNEEFPSQDILSKPSISYIVMQHTHHGYLNKFISRHSRPASTTFNGSTTNKTNSYASCTSTDEEPEENSSKPLLSHSCLIYIAAQISEGMSYLEQAGLIHRDLSTRNCLVGPRLSILITDLAMDNVKFQKDYISVTTTLNDLSALGLEINRETNCYQPILSLPLQWMSWEAVLKARYSSKSDVWSFGVLFWDLLTYCKSRPYFCVPQYVTSIDQTANYVKCLSLLYNFKCLEQGFDNALLPNNESMSQIRKGNSWMTPLPLPVPSQFINIPTEQRCTNIQTPRMMNKDNSISCILDSNKEIRDLITSCWSIEPSNRPKFKDINTFLRQKINNFNVEDEYQFIQTTIRRS